MGAVPAVAAAGVFPGASATGTAPSRQAGPRAVDGPFAVAPVGRPAPSSAATTTAGPGRDVTPVAFVTTTARPGSAAARAIEFALAQRGLPYVWGGDGPNNGDAGFDCSGLTTAAYAYAGVTLPRTAHTQLYVGPHVPDGAPLQPGDLVFYGVPSRVHHVGLYIGGGRMVNAPTFGEPLQLAYVRYQGDDYVGATRPAAGKDAPGLIATPDLPVPVPPVPSPGTPPGPSDFTAPHAPDPAPDRVSGPATPQQLQDAAGGPAAQQADVGTRPLTEGTADPTPTPRPAPSGSAVSGPAPSGSTPPGSTPPGSTPPGSTPTGSEPPGIQPTATAPPTAPPSVTTAPIPTPPVATPPLTTPTVTKPPATKPPATTPPATTPTATTPMTTVPAATAPTGLVLPGGATLTLARAATGADGLPAAPATASSGALAWYPGTGDAWTAAVSISPAVATGPLRAGASVVVTGPGGARTTLTVRSVRTGDAATAKASAHTLGSGPRVVLLRTDPATGQVLVVVAS